MTTRNDAPEIGMGAYPWMQILGGGADFPPREAEAMARTAAVGGIALWEPFLPETPEAAAALTRSARDTGPRVASAYVNARLHEDDRAARIADVLRRTEALLPLGLRYLVVNPEPISWRGAEDKDDARLRAQAAALGDLGAGLNRMGVRLAYHTHHSEMRQAAREFHHMLRATDPADVGLCLDAHWIYRGAGNSRIALEDIVGMYADRVVTLHLRQSVGGVWSESFMVAGDIDYAPIAATLAARGFSGPLVLEQAREAGTPETMPVEEALRRGAAEAARLGATPGTSREREKRPGDED